MKTECEAIPLIEDTLASVTRFDFKPGQETGWHVQEFNYVIVALTDCQMELVEPCGDRHQFIVPAGTAYRRDAGIEHNVINADSEQMSFVEIEIKCANESRWTSPDTQANTGPHRGAERPCGRSYWLNGGAE